MDGMKGLVERAKRVRDTEGIVSLLRRSFAFVFGSVVFYRTYDLYESIAQDMDGYREADFLPKIERFTFAVIASLQDAEELKAKGLDLYAQMSEAHERLARGAVAFCIFAGRQLAHISWFAMSQTAKDAFYEPPFTVAFSDDEVCSAGAWTHPRYRGMGLGKYAHFKRSQFKADRGISKSKSAIARPNTAMRRAYAGPMPGKYAEGRYLKILWWKSWKETPVKPQH